MQKQFVVVPVAQYHRQQDAASPVNNMLRFVVVLAIGLAVIAAAVGSIYYIVEVVGSGTRSPDTGSFDFTSGDYVEVLTRDSFNPKFLPAFQKAAKRWSTILNGTTLVAEIVQTTTGGTPRFNREFDCGAVSEFRLYTDRIDHLFILADVITIDGPGAILGQAGPCQWFGITDGTIEAFTPQTKILPNIGYMQFDADDIEDLYETGDLEATILHEMAHVLGFGTFWDIAYPEQSYFQTLIANPVYQYNQNGQLTANPNNNPRFTGSNAKMAWSALNAGLNSGDVPVQGACCNSNGVPYDVENGEGQGTIDGHWSESVFESELMTGFISTTGSNPLSQLTIKSLKDIGFVVDETKADPYSLLLDRRLDEVSTRNVRGHRKIKNDVRRMPRNSFTQIMEKKKAAARSYAKRHNATI